MLIVSPTTTFPHRSYFPVSQDLSIPLRILLPLSFVSKMANLNFNDPWGMPQSPLTWRPSSMSAEWEQRDKHVSSYSDISLTPSAPTFAGIASHPPQATETNYLSVTQGPPTGFPSLSLSATSSYGPSHSSNASAQRMNPPSKPQGSSNRAAVLRPEDWIKYKTELWNLWVQAKMSLPETMAVMSEKYKFKAS
jgi:hypothetical protein